MFWGYRHNVWEMFFVDYINFYILLFSVAYYNQNAMLNASEWCCTSQRRWTDQWHLLLDLQQGHINIFLLTPGLPKAATCWLLTVISKNANQQRPLAASRASPLSPLVTVVQITRQWAALGWFTSKNADDEILMPGKGQWFSSKSLFVLSLQKKPHTYNKKTLSIFSQINHLQW